MDADKVRQLSESGIDIYQDQSRFPPELRSSPWGPVVYAILTAYRDMSDSMITAMAETPWPEDMSAPDQLRAMHNAAIDAVIGPKR